MALLAYWCVQEHGRELQRHERVIARLFSASPSWHIGILAYWHTGVLAYWHIGILAYWHIGILAYWHIGILAYCDAGRKRKQKCTRAQEHALLA